MEEYNLNIQPADGPTPEQHAKRRSALPQWLAVLIVALALVTLVLMIMLVSAAREGSLASSREAETTTKKSSTETTVAAAPIVVVQKTDYMTENAASGKSSGSGTTTLVSQPSAPAAEPEPASPKPSEELVLTGVDEDVATARASAAGYTVYSVYGFPAIAASSGITLPPAGQVFRWEPFAGRTMGERFAFLYVQTTEPAANAVSVPSVQGKAWKDARAALAAAGLGIRYVYEENSPATYGTVVLQAPSSGSLMPRGSSVVVVLAD